MWRFLITSLASPDLDLWAPIEDISDLGVWDLDPDFGQPYTVRGVSQGDFMDLRQGVVEIVEGQTFTEEQVANGEHVVVISQPLAEYNNLQVGDFITLHNSVPNETDEGGRLPSILLESYTVEIIGLFNVVGIEDITFSERLRDWTTYYELRAFDTMNRLYLPASLVLEASHRNSYEGLRLTEERGERLGFEVSWEFLDHYQLRPIFVLHDPLDVGYFSEAVYQLLGGAVHISEGSHRFAPITATMTTMRTVADGVLVGASIASVVILALIVTLFFYDRRHEVGIYLALGERRRKIVSQLLTEVFIVATFAITSSLLVGTLVANHLTMDLLQEEVAGIEVEPTLMFTADDVNLWEAMGLPAAMTGEEMLEFYDVSLNAQTILLFYLASFGVIVISTVVPTIYLVRLSPKKILMTSNIG